MTRKPLRVLAALAAGAAILPVAPSSAQAHTCGCTSKQVAAGNQDTAGMLNVGRVRVSSSTGVS